MIVNRFWSNVFFIDKFLNPILCLQQQIVLGIGGWCYKKQQQQAIYFPHCAVRILPVKYSRISCKINKLGERENYFAFFLKNIMASPCRIIFPKFALLQC